MSARTLRRAIEAAARRNGSKNPEWVASRMCSRTSRKSTAYVMSLSSRPLVRARGLVESADSCTRCGFEALLPTTSYLVRIPGTRKQ